MTDEAVNGLKSEGVFSGRAFARRRQNAQAMLCALTSILASIAEALPLKTVSGSPPLCLKAAAYEFAESYNSDGGSCTVISLPDIGITGNSHFMFQEMNSDEIAQLIQNWIDANVD